MFTIEQVNELKKALHYCGNVLGCEVCPYNKVTCCQDKLNKDALALILDYEDTIQQLEAETDKQYEQAKADILGNMADSGTSCHWCIAQHEAKAIKEFEEQSEKILIEHYKRYHDIANQPKKKTDMFYQGRAEAIWECIDINRNLLKEMRNE